MALFGLLVTLDIHIQFCLGVLEFYMSPDDRIMYNYRGRKVYLDLHLAGSKMGPMFPPQLLNPQVMTPCAPGSCHFKRNDRIYDVLPVLPVIPHRASNYRFWNPEWENWAIYGDSQSYSSSFRIKTRFRNMDKHLRDKFEEMWFRQMRLRKSRQKRIGMSNKKCW